MRHPSRRRVEAALALTDAVAARAEPAVCGLCGRPIVSSSKSSLHHLVPRLKGGTNKGTVRLHQICHSAVHARFSETELAREFSELATLRAAPQLQDFLIWVQDKPADFHVSTRMTRARREQRRDRER